MTARALRSTFSRVKARTEFEELITRPEPILALDIETAAEIAIDVARQRWPKRDRDRIPFATGRAS